MSFDNPRGTRGRRQPKGRLVAWFNRTMAKRAGRRGSMMGMSVLSLITIGRKSGQERRTPLARFPGPDGSFLIVASAAGAQQNPAWYLNLAANPERVRVEVEGRSIDVIAEELHGQERSQAWDQILAASPNFANYEKRTDREIPVIRLKPRG
ncbi:MAG: nitroreductase/quinone reductase family protein [Ornithinimicrobium sp.]